MREEGATRKPPGKFWSKWMANPPNSCAPTTDCCGPLAALSCKVVLFCVLATAVSTKPFWGAQKTALPLGSYSRDGKFPQRVHSSMVDTTLLADEETCFPWNLSQGRSKTVNAKSLKVPSQARREYEKACDASNKNKFEEAELRARNAIDAFPDYSAAWVMLGVILEEQHKSQEARDACSHAVTIDATYLPAYLCGAEMSVRNQEWELALKQATLAAGLQSVHDAYAYYYLAMAYLHLNNLVEAKKNGLRAAEINGNHDEPSLDLLLAEIYERGGDNADAIAQLEQLLKHHANRQQEDAARQFLARLESQPSTK